MQTNQTIDDREDEMVISQCGGSVVVTLQLVKSIYRDGAIVDPRAVVPDELIWKFEQS